MFVKCYLGLVLVAVLGVNPILTVSVQKLQQTYEAYLNLSLLIEKQDKVRMNNWTDEFQIELVNVTTKYRMEMTKHQLHSFKKKPLNDEWILCQKHYPNKSKITKSEQSYYVRENECLKEASYGDVGKREAITQVGREIRKWRRSYRYLMNKCAFENPSDKEKSEICLVNYMEKDNYSHTFKRLIDLRSKLVNELHKDLRKSVQNLDECLRIQLSKYLEQIRSIMEILNQCYQEKVSS